MINHIKNTALHNVYERNLKQEIKHFLDIAIPMLVSFSTEPIMHFFDRLFLSFYKQGEGEVYVSASFSGGLTAFSIFIFFGAIARYSSTLVSQHHGAGKDKECGTITYQSILFALFTYPILFFIAMFFLDDIFAFFNHDAKQQALELQYGQILLLGGIISLLRSGMGGFFNGLGKTKIIMFSAIIGMCLNIPLNYILIFGKLGIPALGIAGAAYATLISTLASLLILCAFYYNKQYHTTYHTRIPLKLNMNYMKKLIKYGFPSGVESSISVGVFSLFILVMSTYGQAVGATVAIVLNLESMIFIPMLGASFATSALAGQYMGRRNIKSTIRIMWISLITNTIFVTALLCVLLFSSNMLIGLFTAEMTNTTLIFTLGKTMLLLIPLYLFFDGISLSVGSVLRGAGDTKGLLIISLIVDILFAITIALFILPQKVSPIQAWFFFIGFAIFLGFGAAIRMLQGKWKHIHIVDYDIDTVVGIDNA